MMGRTKQDSSAGRIPALRQTPAAAAKVCRRTGRRRILLDLAVGVLFTALFVGAAAPAGSVPPPPDNPSDEQIQGSQNQATASAAEVGRLAGLASKTEGDIARLTDDMELKAELTNKAAVDLQVAQSDAAAAAASATRAQAAATAAEQAIDTAKTKAAAFAAASFRQGSVLGSLTALLDSGSATDLLQRRELLDQMAGSQLTAIENLRTTRDHKANLDSTARAALDAATAAQTRADDAKVAADAAQQQAAQDLQSGQAQLAALESQLTRQQQDYQTAISTVAGLQGQRQQYTQWLAQKQAEEEAARRAAEEAARLAEEAAAKQAAEEAARQAAEEATRQAAAAEQAARGAAAEAEAAAERAAAEQETRNQSARDAQQALAEQNNEPSYDSCDAARSAGQGPIARGESGYRSALDPNGNGIACEGTAAAAEVGPAPTPEEPYYDSCGAARSAGLGPIARGESGYRSALDPNSNGIACEGQAPTATPAPAQPVGSLAGGSGSSRGQQVVDAALQYLGTTYAWGGGDSSGPTQGIRDGGVADSFGDYKKVGFDCSGLTLYAWAKAGVFLPHYSAYQYAGQPKISRDELQPGDLVFYATNTSDPSTIHHVAMWMGNNQVVEAKNSGTYVKISTVSWSGYIGAVRPGG